MQATRPQHVDWVLADVHVGSVRGPIRCPRRLGAFCHVFIPRAAWRNVKLILWAAAYVIQSDARIVVILYGRCSRL